MTRMTWLAVAGLLVGCASGAPASAPVAGADGFATSGSLDNTRWSLVDSRLTAAPPEDRNAVRLEFTADRLNARGGCNTSAGGYRLEDGVLSLTGQMATTMRACIGPGAEFEPEFLAFLASRPSVTVDAREMVLESPMGMLRMQSEPMPSAAAVQKFIYVAAQRAPCVGVAPMQCLQIRDSADEPWRLHYGEIIDFTHEPGIEYRLRILEDTVANPPADGSSKRWFLDLVVEQRVVEPKAP